MILLDSNIIIYLRDPAVSDSLIDKLRNERLDTCNIVISEVLGFKGLGYEDTRYFSDLFHSMKNHSFDENVTREVINVRKHTSIQLPDAIIAGTAIANRLTLWTHNTEDFLKVKGLQIFDPITV